MFINIIYDNHIKNIKPSVNFTNFYLNIYLLYRTVVRLSIPLIQKTKYFTLNLHII